MNQKEFTNATPHPPPNASSYSDHTQFYPWVSIGQGIWELHLNGGPGPTKSTPTLTAERSVLQYYEPGARSVTMEIITHDYIEEVVFLDGGLKDVTLGKLWGRGAYAYRLPGMEHGPYIADEEHGVLQFVKCVPVQKSET